MRHDYYSHSSPGQRPVPYGEVPSQSAGEDPEPEEDREEPEEDQTLSDREEATALRRTPDAWERPPREQRGSGVVGFVLFLILLLGLTGYLIWARGGLPAWTSPVAAIQDAFGDLWPGAQDPWEDDGENWEDEDWTEDLENTTIKRAPTGDGTTLSLTEPAGESLSAQEIYQRVSPAVVGIRAYLENSYSLGTGIVMSEDGYIVTNAHIIAGASQVEVDFSGKDRTEALLVGYDQDTDLAVLKIDAAGLTVAEFGDSATLQVGDVAYAIGNPLGEELRGTMTDGIISAIDRTVTVEDGEMTLIQTTAALNSGNSGGALINCYGQVVGITNMKMMSNWETIEGLGFAIPTATAKEVVDQLIEKGRYSGAPMLGITGSTAWATKDCPAGAYVVSVEPKSDAYAKGVRAGQIIIGANGQTVTCFEDLQEAKEGLDIGDEIELEIWTETGTSKVRVALVGRNDLD